MLFKRKPAPVRTAEERAAEFMPTRPILFADGSDFPSSDHLIALQHVAVVGYGFGRGEDRKDIVMVCSAVSRIIQSLPEIQPTRGMFENVGGTVAFLREFGLKQETEQLLDAWFDICRYWRETGALDRLEWEPGPGPEWSQIKRPS